MIAPTTDCAQCSILDCILSFSRISGGDNFSFPSSHTPRLTSIQLCSMQKCLLPLLSLHTHPKVKRGRCSSIEPRSNAQQRRIICVSRDTDVIPLFSSVLHLQLNPWSGVWRCGRLRTHRLLGLRPSQHRTTKCKVQKSDACLSRREETFAWYKPTELGHTKNAPRIHSRTETKLGGSTFFRVLV